MQHVLRSQREDLHLDRLKKEKMIDQMIAGLRLILDIIDSTPLLLDIIDRSHLNLYHEKLLLHRLPENRTIIIKFFWRFRWCSVIIGI